MFRTSRIYFTVILCVSVALDEPLGRTEDGHFAGPELHRLL